MKGHRPNHILHRILSIITLGIWLIVWIIVGLFGGETRRTITVQPDGRVVDGARSRALEVRERQGGRDTSATAAALAHIPRLQRFLQDSRLCEPTLATNEVAPGFDHTPSALGASLVPNGAPKRAMRLTPGRRSPRVGAVDNRHGFLGARFWDRFGALRGGSRSFKAMVERAEKPAGLQGKGATKRLPQAA